VSAVGVPTVAALVAAGDSFATWLLQRSAGGDFGARMTALGQTVALTTALGGGAASALTLLIALLAILGALAQAVVLVLRGAILVILTATLPLAASATNTDLGRQWWSKSCAWLIAFIVFKPAAALVYAGAFYLIGAGTDAQSVIAGLMTLALAAFTLPALMKLLVPAVASASSSVSAAEMLAVGGAMATGAVAVGQLGGKATTGSSGGGTGGGAARDVTQTGGGPAGSGGGAAGPARGGGSPGGSGSPAGSAGTSAGAGASSGAGAGAGGAAAGGGATAAGAAAGPAGAAVGAAVTAGARVVHAGAQGAALLGNAAAGQDAGGAANRTEQGDQR